MTSTLPILIFDLDDTLYPEITFVKSGFNAVAVWLEQQYGWESSASLSEMNLILQRSGRGAVFDEWLKRNGVTSRQAILRCIHIYRHHAPTISLYPEAQKLLTKLRRKPYVVTDGHKVAQHNKVKALALEECCEKVILTRRYGIQNEKPSTLCFQRIKEAERCRWENMVYIADNPAKDFVGLNPLGVRTIRVRTGAFAKIQAKPSFDAKYSIQHLGDLPEALSDLNWK